MSLYEPIEETGLLLRDGRRIVLQVDDGGAWELDIHPRYLKLIGQLVTVAGTRDGYDLIAVKDVAIC